MSPPPKSKKAAHAAKKQKADQHHDDHKKKDAQHLDDKERALRDMEEYAKKKKQQEEDEKKGKGEGDFLGDNKNSLVGGLMGALLGMMIGGPIGAIIGLIFGLLIGGRGDKGGGLLGGLLGGGPNGPKGQGQVRQPQIEKGRFTPDGHQIIGLAKDPDGRHYHVVEPENPNAKYWVHGNVQTDKQTGDMFFRTDRVVAVLRDKQGHNKPIRDPRWEKNMNELLPMSGSGDQGNPLRIDEDSKPFRGRYHQMHPGFQSFAGTVGMGLGNYNLDNEQSGDVSNTAQNLGIEQGGMGKYAYTDADRGANQNRPTLPDGFLPPRGFGQGAG